MGGCRAEFSRLLSRLYPLPPFLPNGRGWGVGVDMCVSEYVPVCLYHSICMCGSFSCANILKCEGAKAMEYLLLFVLVTNGKNRIEF